MYRTNVTYLEQPNRRYLQVGHLVNFETRTTTLFFLIVNKNKKHPNNGNSVRYFAVSFCLSANTVNQHII